MFPDIPLTDDGDDGFFNGKMAEIRLWDYARTPIEMKKDWNRAISHIAKGLLGLWTMKIKRFQKKRSPVGLV